MEAATLQFDRAYGHNVTLGRLDAMAERWARLREASPAATLYHRAPWLEVLRRAWGLDLYVALAADGEAVEAGCLLAKVGGRLRSRMVGLPFSDACAPLWTNTRARAALLHRLAALGGRRGLSIELRGLSAPRPWTVVDHFLDWQLDLDTPLARLEAAASQHFRRQVRRGARQGISIECASDASILRRFYALMLETRRRQGVPPPPWKLFDAVRGAFGPGDLAVWMARKARCDLAGCLILRDGDRLHYRWAARAQAQAEPGANHLLVWSLIENSAQKFAALELGRTDRRNAGLNRFKQELGASSRSLPYSFFPEGRERVSPEALTGVPLLLSRIWRHLPIPVTRLVGGAIYRHFA